MNFHRYEDIRSSIEDGDIVFIKGSWKSLPQALIMFFTRSKFAHVALAFWVETSNSKRLMVVEAHGKSSRRIVNLSHYDGHEMIVMKAVKPWGEMEADALNKVAKVRYGYFEGFYIGLRDVFLNVFGIKLPTWNLPAEVCSSLVARLIGMKDPIVSPQGLYEDLLEITEEK